MSKTLKILFLARPGLYSQFGGDSIQVEYTAKYLRLQGFDVFIHPSGKMYDGDFDILHFFNLTRPAQLLPYLKRNKPIVISSIYVDYSEYDRKNRTALKFIFNVFGKNSTEYFKSIARFISGSAPFPGWKYLLLGQKSSIRKILRHSNALITASKFELEHIQKDFGHLPAQTAVINLGIEHMPEDIRTHNRSGLICVARIEGLKNQLNLIKALKSTKFKLKLIGKATANQPDYFRKCRKAAGKNVDFLGHLSGEEVSEELQKSKVHILPSYFETTGLASIEALYNGCSIVISDRGAQKEIFGQHAFYCNPDDVQSIRNAINEAYESNINHRLWVKNNFSWQKAAAEIHTLYLNILKK